MTIRTFLVIFACLFSVALWAQPSKNFHQVFTPKAEITKLVLDIAQAEDIVEVRKTQGSRIMVEATVRISLPNETLLQYLVDNGRYNLVESTSDADAAYILSTKKNNNVIMIKGEECHEEVTYIIYVPESIPSVIIKDASGGMTATN